MADEVREISDDDFETSVIQSDMPVMLDIWAPWCGPCRLVAPVVEELARQYEGRVAIFKLNIDKNTDTAADYGVTSIPAMLFFRDGKELADKRMTGAMSKEDYEAVLDEIAGA